MTTTTIRMIEELTTGYLHGAPVTLARSVRAAWYQSYQAARDHRPAEVMVERFGVAPVSVPVG